MPLSFTHILCTVGIVGIVTFSWGLGYGILVLLGLMWVLGLGLILVGISEMGKDRRAEMIERRKREQFSQAMARAETIRLED